MKSKLQFAAILLPLCLLAGCGNQPDSQADAVSADSTETTETTTGTTAAVLTETTAEASEATDTETTASAETTTEAVTTTAVSTTAGPMFTVTVPEKKAQGGEGGEEHADDPDPNYFVYQFSPEGVAVRLSGGNYQSIAYDFSKTAENGIEKDFFLLDMSFDGCPDLFVPVEKKDDTVTYAVFVWNSEAKKYAETPILLDNPTVSAEKKLVTAVRKLSSTSVMLTGYEWQAATLAQSYIVYADFSKLTLSYKTLSDQKISITDFKTAAELSEKLRSYQS